MGHIINLIAEEYLFGQDSRSFEIEAQAADVQGHRQLWRQRGVIGKLHNILVHIMSSGKRTELFQNLQQHDNIGDSQKKIMKVLLDGGIRWNATYIATERALQLREAIDAYVSKLRSSLNETDRDVFQNDFLDQFEWETIGIIKIQLEPLYRITKSLEGNASLSEGAMKSFNSSLWEVLPAFEYLLQHFEKLQTQCEQSDFDAYPRIQSSVTHAWNKTNEYYTRTDTSIAWVASMVLHPRWKWKYFERNWIGSQATYVT